MDQVLLLRIFLAQATSLTSYCHDSKQQMETKLLYAINADAGFDLSWYRMCILVRSHTSFVIWKMLLGRPKIRPCLQLWFSVSFKCRADDVLGQANYGLEGKSVNMVKALEKYFYVYMFILFPTCPSSILQNLLPKLVSSRYRYACINRFRLFTCVQ